MSEEATEAGIDPLIQLSSATVVRGGKVVLNQINLSIAPGDHTVILGPNGSGKSTLVKLFTGEVYPLATAVRPPVRILGRDRWHLNDLRSQLGIISADLHHRFVSGSSMGRATAAEAVVASYFGSEVIFLHHRATAEMLDRAAAALDRMAAGSLADRPMNEMSSGEVRRVLIARALVHEPAMLILDEPTTGLDAVARHELLTHLRNLARSGTTLVLVTHHVEEVFPEVKHVVLLKRGEIVAEGTAEEVLTSDWLSKMFGAQVLVEKRDHRFGLRLP